MTCHLQGLGGSYDALVCLKAATGAGSGSLAGKSPPPVRRLAA